MGDELRFWFITSGAEVQAPAAHSASAVETQLATGEMVWIAAQASTHTKCERCWHQRADVGTHAKHPTLCGRCVENVDGAGERRQFI